MNKTQLELNNFLQNLNDYDRKFQELVLNRNQFELYSYLAKDIFNDFPNNLPKELLMDYFGRRYVDLHNELKKRELNTEELNKEKELYNFCISQLENKSKITKIGAILGNIHQISRYYLNMESSEWPDFKNIRLSQEIISSCSIAEGFIVDTIKLINERSKEIQYDNNKIYNLCYGSIGEKLKKISNEFELEISLNDKQKFDLKKLVKTRNLIVHNSSKADKKWISYFKADINIEDKIILSSTITENLLDNLIDSMYELYRKVSLKYLDKDEKYIFNKLIDVK
ncbi:hypothetical protein [Zunongwangia sp.]|uniref:hypothetical protein n=1 Tax=Zunongwangia sp. TaxID=1965325 RepID=UPI003AA966F8